MIYLILAGFGMKQEVWGVLTLNPRCFEAIEMATLLKRQVDVSLMNLSTFGGRLEKIAPRFIQAVHKDD
jgi:hypothetical protein